MVEASDFLIRFLLPQAKSRGVIIQAGHITARANAIHGLQGDVALAFNQTLLASILLLSINKGGVRQVLQLDATDPTAPLQRILAETRAGAVRGYLNWQAAECASQRHPSQCGTFGEWIGETVRLSTVRDLGVGQPYISTIASSSSYLADHLVHYLQQSVQIMADVVIHQQLAILIEAMPGCDEASWFKAVDALAKIPDSTLDEEAPEAVLEQLQSLDCRIIGRDPYRYHCNCQSSSMAQAIAQMPATQLDALADSDGTITLACQYCDAVHTVRLDDIPTTKRTP